MGTIRVEASEGRNDGTGQIVFLVIGIDASAAVVPGRHTSVEIPATSTYGPDPDKTVERALQEGTTEAKNTYLHELILEKVNGDWTSAALNAIRTANDATDSVMTDLVAHWGDSGDLPVDLPTIE